LPTRPATGRLRCFCCDAEIALARKVKIRPWIELDPTRLPAPDSAAYHSYVQQMTYRWGFVCIPCYRLLDNESGLAEVGSKQLNIAGQSRGDKAPVVDQAKYEAFQRKEAAKLGLE
jgi:hypothetical protein